MAIYFNFDIIFAPVVCNKIQVHMENPPYTFMQAYKRITPSNTTAYQLAQKRAAVKSK
jgi:hypothetical protein